jgi:hypothetical protein
MSCCYVDVLLPGVVVETRMGIGNGESDARSALRVASREFGLNPYRPALVDPIDPNVWLDGPLLPQPLQSTASQHRSRNIWRGDGFLQSSHTQASRTRSHQGFITVTLANPAVSAASSHASLKSSSPYSPST